MGMRWRERALAPLAVAAVAALGTAAAALGTAASPARADDPPHVLSSTFTSADVGFSEGGIRASMIDKFDGMDTFVGAKKPIVRVDLEWAYLEPASCPGPCDDGLRWDLLDQVVNAANSRDERVLVMLGYGPSWATGHTDGNWFPTADHDQDWVDVVDAAVRHFGPRVQAYEVWNEPNITQFADYGDATGRAQRIADRQARYWQLVKLAYPTVKRSCPSCTVLAGGSAPAGDAPADDEWTNDPNTAASWLRAGYAAGARGYFDAVAYHPYPAANSGLGPNEPQCDYYFWNGFGPPFYTDPVTGRTCGGELADVRQAMVANGDGAKKIWATEWGYPTTGDDVPALPLATIRDYMVEGVYMWRALSYTGPLFLYSYGDGGGDANDPCTADPSPSMCHYGVVTDTGVPKEPLYSDLSTALRGDFPSSLLVGGVLRQNSALRSDDGRFTLRLQSDGDLVLSQVVKSTARVLWSVPNLNGTRFVVRPDGDLVLQNPQQQAVWESHSGQGAPLPVTLRLQDDGNLVLYRDADDSPIWSSGTCCH